MISFDVSIITELKVLFRIGLTTTERLQNLKLSSLAALKALCKTGSSLLCNFGNIFC